MAEDTKSLPQPNQVVHQAGGGVSGEEQHGRIKVLSPAVLPHLTKVFNCHADNNKSWHKDQASTFIRCTQAGDPASVSDGLPPDIATKGELDFNDFLQYMTSDASNVLGPLKESDQDLSYPLSSYFISSSHNTYLTGNQLYGEASTDAYKNVLLRGCRCIEIDVWDGDDSDSESEYSSSDLDDDDPKKAEIYAKRKEKVEKYKGKIPSKMLSKFEKTSIGKKFGKYVEKKTEIKSSSPPPPAPAEGEAKAGAAADDKEKTASTPSLHRMPTVPAGIVEPRVLHGHTLTKEVSFREVCNAIREHAFVATDLPLIVSLEVHAGSAQQEIMVQIIEQVWEGLLVPPPDKDAKVLPPPGDLRRKILVKVKYAPPGEEVAAVSDEDKGQIPPEAVAKSKKNNKKKKKAASKIIHALSSLGIYTRGVSFKSLSQPEATMPTHVFALSEKKVLEVHEKQPAGLFEHNLRYMMRAYPSGLRIRSSNLDPSLFWRKGIQIVALNWQNWDEGMMLCEGMFAGSGGYVLKPEGYRCSKPGSSAEEQKTQHVQHHNLDLEIKIFAGQNLPLPPDTTKEKSFDPYVKVELHVEQGGERHGHFADDAHECPPATTGGTTTSSSSSKATAVPATKVAGRQRSEDDDDEEGEYKARTKTVKGTCDPDFKGEALEFKAIPGVVEELSFIRFIIRDDEAFRRDDLAAWACVRLDRLRVGYRFVHLLDAKGRKTDGVLLVKVSKKVY